MRSWITLSDGCQTSASATKLLGCSFGSAAAVILPVWLYGVEIDLIWSVMVLLLSAFGATLKQNKRFLLCLFVIGLGLVIDFACTPPYLMGVLCVAGSGVSDVILEQLHLMPAASTSMLLVLLPTRRSELNGRYPIRWLLNLILMLLVVVLMMLIMQELAKLLSRHWGAEAWVFAMTVGVTACITRS